MSWLRGFVDSDWALDSTHQHSIIGFAYILASEAVIYTTRFQNTVALSSTEAAFVAALDTGKLTLYLHSLLADLRLDHEDSILLYEDNVGAFMMTDSEKPTQRTQHIDICHFALLEWVEQDLVCLKQISTKLNMANILTKSKPRIIFHCQNDILMGKFSLYSFAQVRACFAYAVQLLFPITADVQICSHDKCFLFVIFSV